MEAGSKVSRQRSFCARAAASCGEAGGEAKIGAHFAVSASSKRADQASRLTAAYDTAPRDPEPGTSVIVRVVDPG